MEKERKLIAMDYAEAVSIMNAISITKIIGSAAERNISKIGLDMTALGLIMASKDAGIKSIAGRLKEEFNIPTPFDKEESSEK